VGEAGDAKAIVSFVELLLRFVYEFPARARRLRNDEDSPPACVDVPADSSAVPAAVTDDDIPF
jgi:hypothetical protein